MNVKDLIERLKEMDQEADVGHLWDGCVRSAIEHVYMSKSGECVTSDYKMVCYHNCDRPIDAPTPEQDKYWETAKV